MTASLCHDLSLMRVLRTPRFAVIGASRRFVPIVCASVLGPRRELSRSQVDENPEQGIDVGLVFEMEASCRTVAPSDSNAEQPVGADGPERVLIRVIVANIDGGRAGEQSHGVSERDALVR